MATLLAAAPVAASGLYASGSGGLSLPTRSTFSSDSSVIDGRWISYHAGFRLAAAGGYRWPLAGLGGDALSLRTEARLALQRSGLDNAKGRITLSGGGVEKFSATGQVRTATASAALWLDYALPNTALTAYGGGGLGMSRVALTDFSAPSAELADDGAWAPALQLGLGASYPLGGQRRFRLGYGFSAVGTAELADATGGTLDLTVQSHGITVGLHQNF